jgi:hypothetical protein
MLYAGATMLEGIAVWMYFNGFSLWTVGLVAAIGFALLLILDWVGERKALG